MDDLKRRTVIAGAGAAAVAALAVIAPSKLQAMSKVKSDSNLTIDNTHSNLEPGQYWVWFGGHWD